MTAPGGDGNGRRVKVGERDGFSLLELLIAVALAGIVLGLATSSLLGFVNGYRVEAAARVAWSDMQSARMAAIKANQSVSVRLTGGTGYSYSYLDGFSTAHTFSQDFSGDYPGVTISFQGPTTITFDSMGMAQPATPGTNTTVTLRNTAGTRSFLVEWTGEIGSF